jgi:hypothetical protein
MCLIAKIISASQGDWTQAQTDWTKANPPAVCDCSRRNGGCKSGFHPRLSVSPMSTGSRISDSYGTADRLRDRADKEHVVLTAGPSEACK